MINKVGGYHYRICDNPKCGNVINNFMQVFQIVSEIEFKKKEKDSYAQSRLGLIACSDECAKVCKAIYKKSV